jgi:hypothetical protein
MLRSYDKTRVAPVTASVSQAERERTLWAQVTAFDAKPPGARTAKINDRMAAIYNEVKEKHGVRRADRIPVEDYFLMAGGRLSGAQAAPKGKTRKQKAERKKQAALAATRKPGRISKKPRRKGRRGKQAEEMTEIERVARSAVVNRRDPFNLD